MLAARPDRNADGYAGGGLPIYEEPVWPRGIGRAHGRGVRWRAGDIRAAAKNCRGQSECRGGRAERDQGGTECDQGRGGCGKRAREHCGRASAGIEAATPEAHGSSRTNGARLLGLRPPSASRLRSSTPSGPPARARRSILPLPSSAPRPSPKSRSQMPCSGTGRAVFPTAIAAPVRAARTRRPASR